MKKIMIAAAIVCAAVMAQAASFKWSAKNIVGSDNTGTYSGTVTLQALIDSTWTDVSTATATDGAIKASATTFSSDKLTAGNYYDFRFVITDGDKEFTSATQNIAAQMSDTASIVFGSQTGVTWTGGDTPEPPDPAPEPTSGLLILVGMAGLALRRKHA